MHSPSSSDGITWTLRPGSFTTTHWTSVAYGGPVGSELFVAVGYFGTGTRVMTSI